MVDDSIQQKLAGLGDPLRTLTSLFTSSPFALQIYGVDGRCVLVNDAFRRLFGTEPPPEYNVLEDDVAERSGMLGLIRRAFAGESVHVPTFWYDPRELEQVKITEGRRVAIELHLTPFFGPSGAVAFVLLQLHDRTEEVLARERAESLADALRASEELFRVAQEVSPAGFCYLLGVREGGRLVDLSLAYQNEAAARLNRLPAGRQAAGPRLLQAFPMMSEQPFFKHCLEVLETGQTWRGEAYYGGEHFDDWFQLTAVRVGDGLALTFEVITARKEAERSARALAAATVKLGASLDLPSTLKSIASALLPDAADWGGVHLLKDDGSIELAASEHADPKKATLLHSLFEQMPLPSASPLGYPYCIRTGQAQLVARVGEAELHAAAGDDEDLLEALRTVGVGSVVVAPISAGGRTIGALTFARTRSTRPFRTADLALAEELARRAGAALENARLFALAKAERQRAEDANRSKDEFLAVVSHELRTPLNAMLGWAMILRTGALDAEQRERALAAIERNARAQAHLVEDLLDISRIITGKLKLTVEPVDLSHVVEAALDVVRPAADARGVEVRAVLDRGIGLVSGDSSRLQQIVWNLLSNAVKFTPKGGLVTVTIERQGPSVELTVQDTGGGIDPSFLPHIFERFQQADTTTTRAHGGLGIGLSIVRHLTEAHGGSIEASSEGPGKGARFVVRLPIGAVRSSGQPSPRPDRPICQPSLSQCPPALDGLEVLVVDDEADTRELLSTALGRCGAKVRLASSASDAMGQLKARRPHVLVSDVGMPGEDGYSLMRRVRALPIEQGGATPAVALTAYARPEDRTKALLAGFDMHLAKPIDPGELLVVVANVAGALRPGPGGA